MSTPDNPLIHAARGRGDQYVEAVALAKQKASVSFLQRKLLISYHHAEDLLEQMIRDGYLTDYSGRCIEKVQARQITVLRARIAELEAHQERKPLTDEQIDALWGGENVTLPQRINRRAISRSIERAHGIQEQPNAPSI